MHGSCLHTGGTLASPTCHGGGSMTVDEMWMSSTAQTANPKYGLKGTPWTRNHLPAPSRLRWRCGKSSCFCSQGIWVNHDHLRQPEVENETLFNHQDLFHWRLVVVGSKAQHLLMSSSRLVGGEVSFLVLGPPHQRAHRPLILSFHRRASECCKDITG